MSAIRAVRSLALSTSKTLATRTALLSARARLPVLATRVAVPATRSFTVSARRLGEGTTDLAVSQKLAEELQYEKEASTDDEPAFLKEFKAHGIWEIEDVDGNDEVTLHRKFGNEDIRLIFSIADIASPEEAEFGEETTTESQEEDVHESYPLRCSFSITKASVPGALTIDALCQEGAFVVDNISFYKDGKIATDLTAEADWKRRGLYIGPQFETLDVSVQDEFEKFLQERGINESLAFFVPEYAEHKEQKEYVKWLQNVKTFIEA
ncbi:regulatory protein suaprga1 [Artomyces pyxidatus]|uniref:Regulatory protein suaprga1 n=1 Tax=Artomyces pyxidatus TaxID=48021 RepID=A0ACB8T6T3_9AGAM|nr:regulatory protein suaprga1 [Artomyces pyxidatus]